MTHFLSRSGAGLFARAPLFFIRLLVTSAIAAGTLGFSAQAGSSNVQGPKAGFGGVPSTPSCRSLPLAVGNVDTAVDDANLNDLKLALNDLEAAFATEDSKLFHNLAHPSIHQTLSKSKLIFESVFPTYGLVKPKITRASLYELTFPVTTKTVEVECSGGRARGVVGPERQYMVQHTAFSKNEQMRITTIFAPIPKAVRELNKAKYGIGIVMFHTQAWSHEQKTPVGLLEEARKWNRLKSPVVAWMFAEAAKRILDSNPYFAPRETSEALLLADELKTQLPQVEKVNGALRGSESSWNFLGFTMVYQGYGVEPGFYFRMKEGEVLNQSLDKCRQHVALVLPQVK